MSNHRYVVYITFTDYLTFIFSNNVDWYKKYSKSPGCASYCVLGKLNYLSL